MIVKIRLHGTAEGIDLAVKKLEESFCVMSESDEYSDHGKSRYVRKYLECDVGGIDPGEIFPVYEKLERRKKERKPYVAPILTVGGSV